MAPHNPERVTRTNHRFWKYFIVGNYFSLELSLAVWDGKEEENARITIVIQHDPFLFVVMAHRVLGVECTMTFR